MRATWQVGDRIQNRLEVYNVLQGGMGEVYIVYDHHTSLPFAIKTFRNDLFGNNQTIADRFAQEALAWINLDVHPNIVTAATLENMEGRPLLFLEYISGGDLSNWIGTPRLLEDLSQALRFGIQFCDGMIYAMSKGIKAHRDVKPQNCLITEDKTLKVSDFGLAKIFNDVELETASSLEQSHVGVGLSRTGVGAGTLTHMAPEQFIDAKGVDVRADIYSFGVMFFEMVTGKLPFLGHSFEEFRYLHEKQHPPRLSPTTSIINPIIETCLAKHPNERFANFSQLRAELVEIYERCTGQPAPELAVGAELDASWFAGKSWSLCNLGRTKEALACAEQALESSPDLEMAWNSKGVALMAMKRYEDALQCFDHMMELNPQSVYGWANKGLILTDLGNLEEGIACCERAIEINPYMETGWNNKGKALSDMGQQIEALACLDRALELNPRFDMALYNKGVVMDRLGSFDESIKYYTSVLRINPRMGRAWNNLANSLNEFERFDEALSCLDHAFELNEHLEEVWINKGRAFNGLERPEEALDCYERALGLNPHNEVTWINKGVVLMLLSHHQEACDCFDHALKLNPRVDRAWFSKGLTFNDLGRAEEALKCFDSEIELNPNWSMVWFCKGMTLKDLERNEEAIICLDRALELDPRHADAWCVKGNALKDLEQFGDAIDCYTRALEIDPGQADAWFRLGMIFASVDKISTAMECFKEAQSLGHPGGSDGLKACQQILEEK